MKKKKTEAMTTTPRKSYDELISYSTLRDRYDYLKLNGQVGEELFGYSRYLNQVFYNSPAWKKVRSQVIVRDKGCELGLDGWDIVGPIYVHHMNPITLNQLKENDPCLTDPNNLICTSRFMHDAITYGDPKLIPQRPVERKPNDMCPWKL